MLDIASPLGGVSRKLAIFKMGKYVQIVPSFLYQEYEAVATIEIGAQLMGQVWVNGNFQLKGEVIANCLRSLAAPGKQGPADTIL